MNQEHPTPLSDEPWFEAMLTVWAELGVLNCLIHECIKYNLTDKQIENYIDRFKAEVNDFLGDVDLNGHEIPEFERIKEKAINHALDVLSQRDAGPFLALFGFHPGGDR